MMDWFLAFELGFISAMVVIFAMLRVWRKDFGDFVMGRGKK